MAKKTEKTNFQKFFFTAIHNINLNGMSAENFFSPFILRVNVFFLNEKFKTSSWGGKNKKLTVLIFLQTFINFLNHSQLTRFR